MTSRFFKCETPDIPKRNDRCVILVKPDGVARGLVGKVMARFEDCGIKIVKINYSQPSLKITKLHYKEHENKHFFESATQRLASGTVCAFLIECENAVMIARAKVGESSKPEECKPGTIRADFAHKMSENVIHASDSNEAAARETEIWFTLMKYYKNKELSSHKCERIHWSKNCLRCKQKDVNLAKKKMKIILFI